MNKILIKLEKKKNILQDKTDNCKKKKCYKFYKDKLEEDKNFEKEQDKSCPKKLSDVKFYECSKVFYDNHPELKIKYNKFIKCGDIKCKQITKKRNEITKKRNELNKKIQLYSTINLQKSKNPKSPKIPNRQKSQISKM
jgi:hypothetical protein